MKQVMRAGDYLYLTQARPDLRIADATALFDAVRRIKSAVEIEGLEEAAAIADICFKALLDTARPGETERQIGARMGELCQRLGGEDSLFLTMNSERRGDASHVAMSPPRGRVLDAANPLTFSFEMIGPSGYWTEMCRMISFGPPSQALTETVAAGCAAMSAGCAAMRPGAQAWDIQRSAAAAIDPGRHDLSGWNGHSIGQDVIEPPIVGPPPEAGAAPLAANMALAFHPLLVDRLEGPVFYMANIFVVGDHAARALSRWPQELYVRSA
jgi:Xaa-Pro aminopeptidase